MLIGESYLGEGAEAAHMNTVLGERTGPVRVAWEALRAGVAGTPQVTEVLAARDRPSNPFYSAVPASGPQ